MLSKSIILLGLLLGFTHGLFKPSINPVDVSYVVEVHSSAETFAASEHAGVLDGTEAVLMTAKNGKRFACYLPKLVDPNELSEAEILDRFRQSKTTLSSCFKWVASEEVSYELCPAMTLREIIKSKGEVTTLGDFQSDSLTELLPFGKEKTCLQTAEKSLQTVKAGQKVFTEEFGTNIKVQYICGNTEEIGDFIHDSENDLYYILVLAPLFCDEQQQDLPGDNIQKYLEQLVENNVCVKKHEGWWTYEFCFGGDIRQYHVEQTGEVTAQFSLGKYNKPLNDKREKQGKSITVDYIDGTHDDTRTAYVQHYISGTPCEETGKARRTEVLMYCNPSATIHYILSIKETQTCIYTLKISTPAICTHPRFAKEEARAKENSLAVHCIPYQQEKM